MFVLELRSAIMLMTLMDMLDGRNRVELGALNFLLCEMLWRV